MSTRVLLQGYKEQSLKRTLHTTLPVLSYSTLFERDRSSSWKNNNKKGCFLQDCMLKNMRTHTNLQSLLRWCPIIGMCNTTVHNAHSNNNQPAFACSWDVQLLRICLRGAFIVELKDITALGLAQGCFLSYIITLMSNFFDLLWWLTSLAQWLTLDVEGCLYSFLFSNAAH